MNFPSHALPLPVFTCRPILQIVAASKKESLFEIPFLINHTLETCATIDK